MLVYTIQHIFLLPYDRLSIASIRIIEVYTTDPNNWCLSTWEKEVQLFDYGTRILSMLIGELKMCRLGVVCGIVWSLRKGAV